MDAYPEAAKGKGTLERLCECHHPRHPSDRVIHRINFTVLGKLDL